jgi:hypothetical protein
VALLACASTLPLGPASPAFAASISVTTTADSLDAAASCAAVTLASLPGPDGQTSLREAVCAANSNAGPDVIGFSVNGTFTLTGAANEDNGGTGDLDVKQSLAINGNGTSNTVIDGGGIERIFDVFPSAASTFDLSALTVQNGDTRTAAFKEGGAIYLHNNVTTTLTGIVVQNNFAGANGAIESRGTLTITNSTITGNQTIPTSGSVVAGGLRTSGTTTISNTTISNNTVRGEGGGLVINTGAAVVVTITGSTISGNTASVTGGGLGNGGGISTTGNQGTITITNTTISGNLAENSGGGARWVTPAGGTGNATLNNVTITANLADSDNNGAGTGGGFAQTVAAVTLRNTIVAANTNSGTVGDDISGAVVASSNNNLIGDGTGSAGITNGVNANQVGSAATPIDPLLGALADNTGPTFTHALLAGSPAINTADNATCAATDQRGIARPAGGVCDIGAYELVDLTSPDTTITSNPPNPSNSSSATFTFTGSDTGGSGLAGFQCQLDGAGFTTCTSPHNYNGLGDGSHTFQVRALDGFGNTDPTPAGYAWSIDATAPTVAVNQASGQADPTTASPIHFTAVFSEPVNGFATGDVTLSGTAGPTIALVSQIAPNDSTTYDVAVSGMTTSGTVIVSLSAGVASDDAGNASTASTSTDNTVTFIANQAPSVVINQAVGQADPTNSSPINFTVVFDEPVSGFGDSSADVTLTGTAGATTAVVSEIAPLDGTTYDVAVTGMTTDGTVIATVPAGAASDSLGAPNTASSSTDNTVTFSTDTTSPSVAMSSAAPNPTNASPIPVTAQFSEDVFGFSAADISAGNATVDNFVAVDGNTYTFDLVPLGPGLVTADVPAGVATDAIGNPNTGAIQFTRTFDSVAPAVTIDQASGQADPTGASPIHFTVVFSEPVSGFATGDVTLSGTAGATTAVVTETAPSDGTTYDVAVSGMTTDGTVIASVPAGAATDAAGNGNLASTTNDNTVTYVFNVAPTASVTNGQCATMNVAGGTVSLTLADADGDTLSLALASNSNTTLVPNANVVVGGSGSNRTVTAAAAARRSGTATLTFNLSDGTVTVPVVITVRVGTDKNETLNGTTGIDMIFGLGGTNTINGGAGNDLLCGGNSSDTIGGGDGNDILEGQNGSDTLNGGADDDILRGNSGNDALTGGQGADSFSGGAGTDSASDFSAAQGDTQDGTIP